VILEGLVTTLDLDGSLNLAPMGPKVEPGQSDAFVLRPFQTSTTYHNLKALGAGVLHVTDDVLLIAQGALGRIDANEIPTRSADVVQGRIVKTACRYFEFRVTDIDDQSERTTIRVETVASGQLRPFFGLNRAKHAVIEAAILATRTHILSIEDILADYRRLAPLIEKTGGPDEETAFAMLREHVEQVAQEQGRFDLIDHPTNAGVRVMAPSRLHFGPLAWGDPAPRQFGGAGLMIKEPGLVLRAEPAEDDTTAGPLAGRVSAFAARVRAALQRQGIHPPPARFVLEHCPPHHVGLGTGTQLGLAVARALSVLAGQPDEPVERLASWTGRGQRSGIGLHGFDQGGLIVDGGHRRPGQVPPIVARKPFPEAWHVLIVIPPRSAGLHGQAERAAFAELPPIPQETTDRLCRLVLLELLPAVEENDLPAFGQAITAMQDEVGRWFAPAQGGLFAGPEVEPIVQFLRTLGLRGVGQSSWGPTLYGFDDRPAVERQALRSMVRDRFELSDDQIFWTQAANAGARWGAIVL